MKLHRMFWALPLLAGPLLAADPAADSIATEIGKPYVAASADAPLTKLPAVRVVAGSPHLVREVDAARRGCNLLAPCMLVTKDLPSGRQLQALGAPVKPWRSDPREATLQPLFPLVALAW